MELRAGGGLAEAGKRIGWAEKKDNMPVNRGIGFASMINPSVGVLYAEGNFACVSIDLLADGCLRVGAQSADCGTSQNTVIGQTSPKMGPTPIGLMCCTWTRKRRRLTKPRRVSPVTGNAAIKTAKCFARLPAERLAARWDVPVDKIDFDDGIVSHKTTMPAA